MSKDDKVCTYMRDALNRDLKEYGLGNHKDKFKDSVFTAIKWTSLEKGYGYAGKVASFDINNDRQMDLVIRQSTSGGKSVTFDRLFIFDQGQALESLKTARDLYEKAIGMVNIDFREGYNFRGLPPRTHDSGLMKGQQYYEGMSWNNYIYPFIFDGTAYLLIKRSFDSGPDPARLLIAKYKKGKVQSANAEFMEDICYMK